MPDLWTDLLECCELDRAPSDQNATATFEGRNQQLEYHWVFGGRLLGQFIAAARSVCPDKVVKSLHTVFAREGRADQPVIFEALRHHDGRSFATLTITCRQQTADGDARVLATASISMHVVGDGPQHQDVGDVGPVIGAEHRLALDLIPWETRAVDDLNLTTIGPPHFEFWMRTPDVDPVLAHGRCFGRGDILTEAGVLVASYGQEALLRVAR